MEKAKGKMRGRTARCTGRLAGSAPGPGDAEMVRDTDAVRTLRSKQNMGQFLTLVLQEAPPHAGSSPGEGMPSPSEAGLPSLTSLPGPLQRSGRRT